MTNDSVYFMQMAFFTNVGGEVAGLDDLKWDYSVKVNGGNAMHYCQVQQQGRPDMYY